MDARLHQARSARARHHVEAALTSRPRDFARVHCENCKDAPLVALSCKDRGVCPSCRGHTDTFKSVALACQRERHAGERRPPEAGVRVLR
ncbi:hypothetical protein HPP05_30445 [Corallococcus exiguus]|nr:hypothetical protein [Corallococcus exiguus]